VTIDVPVACITDRDVVPKEAKYVTRPKKGKRFDSDYDPKELERLIERKQARATGGSTKVFVSDCWTLEFDMALAGCSELMYIAIQLAIVDKAGAGALSDDDYEAALAGLKAGWPAYAAAAASPLMLAVQIYEPLYEKDASKAVTAQYAARLLETGGFGNGDELFLMLPRYLQEAMAHLTGPAPIPPAVVAVKMAP
jgi:putative ATP-dependent endonuclease of OLD family